MTQKPVDDAGRRRDQDDRAARLGREAIEAACAEVARRLADAGAALTTDEVTRDLASRVGTVADFERRKRVTLSLHEMSDSLARFVDAMPERSDLEHEDDRELVEAFDVLAERLDAVLARFPVIAGAHVRKRAHRPLIVSTLDAAMDGPWWKGTPTARDLALASILLGNLPDVKRDDSPADVIAREAEKMRTARADLAETTTEPISSEPPEDPAWSSWTDDARAIAEPIDLARERLRRMRKR